MNRVKKWGQMLFGAVIGFVNGLFGGGGGMILVPYLNKTLKLEQKKSQATALFVILPLSIISAIVYMTRQAIDFSVGWPVIIGIVIGGVIGAVALKKLRNNTLQILFVILMIVSGVWMLVG